MEGQTDGSGIRYSSCNPNMSVQNPSGQSSLGHRSILLDRVQIMTSSIHAILGLWSQGYSTSILNRELKSPRIPKATGRRETFGGSESCGIRFSADQQSEFRKVRTAHWKYELEQCLQALSVERKPWLHLTACSTQSRARHPKCASAER